MTYVPNPALMRQAIMNNRAANPFGEYAWPTYGNDAAKQRKAVVDSFFEHTVRPWQLDTAYTNQLGAVATIMSAATYYITQHPNVYEIPGSFPGWDRAVFNRPFVGFVATKLITEERYKRVTETDLRLRRKLPRDERRGPFGLGLPRGGLINHIAASHGLEPIRSFAHLPEVLAHDNVEEQVTTRLGGAGNIRLSDAPEVIAQIVLPQIASERGIVGDLLDL